MNAEDAREALVLRLASAITVTGGRRRGDPETRVSLNHRLPPTDEATRAARWLVVTEQRRLYRAPMGRQALSAWHRADGTKGRRLAVYDLVNHSRVAALLSWHFETGRGRERRPHLVTSAAVSAAATGALRAEYLEALNVLFAALLAIDLLTSDRGEVGIALDAAIEITVPELQGFGFRRGPAQQRGGDYWTLARRSR